MITKRKFVLFVLLLGLLFLQGCGKKKAAIPPTKQAPTLAVVLPDEIPETENPEAPPPPVAQAPALPPATKAKPKKAAKSATNTNTNKKTSSPVVVAATPPAQPPASSQPPSTQTVASLKPPRNPASDPSPETAIVAAIPTEQVQHQKDDTARMVDATENALKGINRQLSDEEKSMRTQVQSFLQQSRKATIDGDYERAYNLAKKAQVLADALIKK